MKEQNIYRHLVIDDYSATPKYLQLANAIIKAIKEGHIEKDYVLPSINSLSFEFDISRDTIEKGYKHLKKLGTINSVPGKGYYVCQTDVTPSLKIFLLFNKLSAHKKIIYDAFVNALHDTAVIDFYIYNNDFSLFKKLLQRQIDQGYTHYVIIPQFIEGGERVLEIINTIPADKLILLDKMVDGMGNKCGAVYENFENDIYNALSQALAQLEKYTTLKMIFPEYSYFPVEILNGFYRFCQDYAFNNKVVHDIAREDISKGDVFINLMEDDLVILIEKVIDQKFIVGTDVGIISYNETPLKKVILNGITTVSTDFEAMGKTAASLVLQNSKQQIEVPFYLTIRNSL